MLQHTVQKSENSTTVLFDSYRRPHVRLGSSGSGLPACLSQQWYWHTHVQTQPDPAASWRRVDWLRAPRHRPTRRHRTGHAPPCLVLSQSLPSVNDAITTHTDTHTDLFTDHGGTVQVVAILLTTGGIDETTGLNSDRHPFNGLFSRTAWVSWHHKGYTDLVLMMQEMMGWR